MDLQPFHAFVKDLPRLALAVAAAAGDGQHENARAAGRRQHGPHADALVAGCGLAAVIGAAGIAGIASITGVAAATGIIRGSGLIGVRLRLTGIGQRAHMMTRTSV